ncbi:MAG TPA: PepSY-associated TM helix domain-containing protein [Thermoanaerobaculia bacterium]
MHFNSLNRKVHYWATLAIALPLLIVIGSGLLLQMKKQWTWVQPEEQRGTGTSPVIDLNGVLAAVQREPRLQVTGWDDVNRIDLRPGRGVAKVWLKSGWEAQVDLGTGHVLQIAYRRSDLIESIHDGSFFGGDFVKLGIFLPTGIILLLMLLSGIWMFVWPFIVKRRRRALAPKPQPQPIN